MDPELKEKLISQDEISADFNDYADFEANNVEGIENCKCPERAVRIFIYFCFFLAKDWAQLALCQKSV